MRAVMTDKSLQVFRWVTCCLADQTYGINVMQVQQVLRKTDVAPVPGVPHCVTGTINLRGNVVPVGVPVDSVAELANLFFRAIEPPPSVGNDEGSRYIQGNYSSEQQIRILIDLDKLINEENREANGMFCSPA